MKTVRFIAGILALIFELLILASCLGRFTRAENGMIVWKPDYRSMPGEPVNIWYTNTNITVIGSHTNIEIKVERSLSKIDPKTGQYTIFDLRDYYKVHFDKFKQNDKIKYVHWKSYVDFNGHCSFTKGKNREDKYFIDKLGVEIDTNRIDYVEFMRFMEAYDTKIVNYKTDKALSEEQLREWLRVKKRMKKSEIDKTIKRMKSFNMIDNILIDKNDQKTKFNGYFDIYVPDDIDVDDFKKILLRFPGITGVYYRKPRFAM